MQTYGAGQGDQRFGAQNVTYVSRMQVPDRAPPPRHLAQPSLRAPVGSHDCTCTAALLRQAVQAAVSSQIEKLKTDVSARLMPTLACDRSSRMALCASP